jgi:hypothetical protein
MAGVGESSLGVCQGKQVPQSPFGGCLGGFQPAKARFLGLFRPTAPVPGRPWPQGPVPLTLARVASCAPYLGQSHPYATKWLPFAEHAKRGEPAQVALKHFKVGSSGKFRWVPVVR